MDDSQNESFDMSHLTERETIDKLQGDIAALQAFILEDQVSNESNSTTTQLQLEVKSLMKELKTQSTALHAHELKSRVEMQRKYNDCKSFHLSKETELLQHIERQAVKLHLLESEFAESESFDCDDDVEKILKNDVTEVAIMKQLEILAPQIEKLKQEFKSKSWTTDDLRLTSSIDPLKAHMIRMWANLADITQFPSDAAARDAVAISQRHGEIFDFLDHKIKVLEAEAIVLRENRVHSEGKSLASSTSPKTVITSVSFSSFGNVSDSSLKHTLRPQLSPKSVVDFCVCVVAKLSCTAPGLSSWSPRFSLWQPRVLVLTQRGVDYWARSTVTVTQTQLEAADMQNLSDEVLGLAHGPGVTARAEINKALAARQYRHRYFLGIEEISGIDRVDDEIGVVIVKSFARKIKFRFSSENQCSSCLRVFETIKEQLNLDWA